MLFDKFIAFSIHGLVLPAEKLSRALLLLEDRVFLSSMQAFIQRPQPDVFKIVGGCCFLGMTVVRFIVAFQLVGIAGEDNVLKVVKLLF